MELPTALDEPSLPTALLAGKPAALARWLNAQRTNWSPLWPELRQWAAVARWVTTGAVAVAFLAGGLVPGITALLARVAGGVIVVTGRWWRRRAQ